MFTNALDAIYYIEHIKRLSRREDLNRMKYALKLLGNPEESFKKIHVAGTNGKGSTVSYIKEILMVKGYKVGAFVSPYVIKFNERIMINDTYISDEDIIKYTNRVKEVTDYIYETEKDVVTFFEFLTLMGFLYFKDNGCDYAVIEVGMGGILDATNVISDSVRVITNIGYDHMHVLGNTLEEIADKKLGIVHKNDILFTTVDNSLHEYFKKSLLNITDKIYFVDNSYDFVKTSLNGTDFIYKNEEFHTPISGLFQATNAKLAIEVVKYLEKDITHDEIQKGLNNTIWKGRFQVAAINPIIIIDGGHNIHGINAVVESIKPIKKDSKLITVFTALKDKETDKMIQKLEEVTDQFIFTEIDDLRKKDATILKQEATKPASIITDYKEAIEKGKELVQKNDILLITGSLHFISFVIKYLKI